MNSFDLCTRAAAVAALGLIALVPMSGCSDDASDLRRWMDEQQQVAPPAVPTVPTKPEFKASPVRSDLAVDPFDTARLGPASRDSGERIGVDQGAMLPVIERQPLEAMSMVGVVDRGGERLALLRVEDSLQTVRVGQRLGVHGGSVVQISDRAVTVSEPVHGALGRGMRRASTLHLAEARP